MSARTWNSLREKMAPERRDRIDQEVSTELVALALRELREQAAMTQTELASAAAMTQTELSKFERREDHRVSTLRRYVEALGGQLEIVAVLGGRRITLKGV